MSSSPATRSPHPAPSRSVSLRARLRTRTALAWNSTPWWLAVVLVYGLSRVWGWIVFTVVGRQQGPGPWSDGAMGYLEFVDIWDSDWYRRIFSEGYPAQVPRDIFGHAEQNQWAFYPLQPLLVRGIDAITGTGWALTASTVSLLAGFGAALVLYRIFDRVPAMRESRWSNDLGKAPLWAVGVFAFNPVAPVLQTPYSEALHLLLLSLAVLSVLRGQALATVIFTVLMALTRPTGVAFAAALGVWWLWRSVVSVRRRERTWYRCADRWLAVALTACAAALSWPVIAWAATGELTAYTETETAWRGDNRVIPVLPWVDRGVHLFGPVAGVLAPLILVVAVVLVLRTRVVKEALPFFARVWIAAYGVYLLLVLHPQSSTFRLLLPWALLAGPLVHVSESKAYRVLLIITGAILQFVWVGWLWHWKQLPGGGDYPP